jgi:uncharacterized membrane protein YdjX (TVP38/TMEM64 family)
MRWALFWSVLLAIVLIPFFLFEEYFNALAARLATGEASGWPAAIAIGGMLASDVLLPIPSSILSTIAGALLGFGWGTVVVWVGMTGACVIGYVLGARASGRARRMVGPEGIERAAAIVRRYGMWALVMCRPVPVLAEASVIFAGIVHTPFRRFLWIAAAANVGIAVSYAAIGAYSMRVQSFLLTFAGALLVPFVAWFVARLFFGERAGLGETLPGPDAPDRGEH